MVSHFGGFIPSLHSLNAFLIETLSVNPDDHPLLVQDLDAPPSDKLHSRCSTELGIGMANGNHLVRFTAAGVG